MYVDLFKSRMVSIDDFENKIDETVTRVWKWNNIFPSIVAFVLISFIPFPPVLKVIVILLTLYVAKTLFKTTGSKTFLNLKFGENTLDKLCENIEFDSEKEYSILI